MNAALETTTRSCKGCDNFQWAGASPTAKASYDAYLEAKRGYDEWFDKPEPRGFWASFAAIMGAIVPRFDPPPLPPYPQKNPDHYGWCRLHPETVKKGVNEWCSHFTSSHNGEGE